MCGAFGVMVASVNFLFGNGCDPWFDSPHAHFFCGPITGMSH